VKQKYSKVEYSEPIKKDKYDSYQIRNDLNKLTLAKDSEVSGFLRMEKIGKTPNMSNKSIRAMIFISYAISSQPFAKDLTGS